MTQRLVTTADYLELSHRAAEYVHDVIRTSPRAVIALPAGRTPIGMYDQLIALLLRKPLDCSGLFLVNLDEYVGLPGTDPRSFAHALRAQLVDRHPMSTASRRLLDGAARNPQLECDRHERTIHARGGLDLVVLGIGVNGHIAFNEPGTSFESRTHVAVLANSTVERSALPAARRPAVPSHGMTMGIGTILQARSILLLTSGAAKARALDATLNGDVTDSNPASALQTHPDLTIIADRAALSLLNPPPSR